MGGPWGPVVAGRGGDVAGEVAVVLGHRGVGARGNRGVVVVLVVALRAWWSWHGVDVCGRLLLAGLLG